MATPTVAERVRALKSIPLFDGLPQRSLQLIVRLSNEMEAPAGQVLVQPRTEGSGLFIVEQGTVVVEKSGKPVELGPGQFFGELALLTTTPRTARVRAKSPVRCLVINRSDFRKLLDSEPRIARGMLEVLARRMADSLQ